MSYIGDIRLGDTIDAKFTTRNFSTGSPFTLAGSPSVACYIGNSTTEVTSGVTLSVDFDSRTGLHNVNVVASSGNGFSAGTNVQIVITSGTVNGVSVSGEVVASFSIENRSAIMPTTAGRKLDVSSGGEAGIDWANIGSPTTTINLSGTTVSAVSGSVGSVTGLTTSTIASAVLSTTPIEGYVTVGNIPTIAQFISMVQSMLMNFSISGTTLTSYESDGSTPAMTFILNSSTSPTSITRDT